MTNSSSSRTIRLHNKVQGNLSFHLQVLRWPAAGSLRRAMALTAVNIGHGQYYDVCAQLDVSYDEACRIVQRSPEVQAFKRSGYLDEYHFPPLLAEEETHVVVTEAPGMAARPVVTAPPTESAAPSSSATSDARDARDARDGGGAGPARPAVTAPPAPVAPAAVTLPPPPVTSSPLDGPPTDAEMGLDVSGQPPAPEGAFSLALPPLPQTVSGSAALDDGGESVSAREPSMDWSEDALRSYAARRGIDLSKAKSKTAVLRAVRTGEQR